MTYEKYVASGNDFILFHTFHHQNRSELAKNLCHRQKGIGADGLIVLLPSHEEGLDFVWEFYNSDGSHASMCGNGARAAALYAYHHQLCKEKVRFLSGAGVIEAKIFSDSQVEVKFTQPKVLASNLLESNKETWLLDTGVPHLVLLEESDINALPTTALQSLRHQYNANVNIAYLEPHGLRVRTFERGVEGETLACGTGMAACFFVALKKSWLKAESFVYPISNECLSFRFRDENIYFKGAVQKIAILQLS